MSYRYAYVFINRLAILCVFSLSTKINYKIIIDIDNLYLFLWLSLLLYCSIVHALVYYLLEHRLILTFFQVHSWFEKLFPEVTFPVDRIGGVIDRTEKQFKEHLSGETGTTAFLQVVRDLDSEMRFPNFDIRG